MILTNFIFQSVAYEEECPWYLKREEFPFEISDEDWKSWEKNKWLSNQKVPELFDKYCEEHNFHQIDREVVNYDLSKRYEDIEVVFSFENKYYKFQFCSWGDGEECDKLNMDLSEVSPHTRTIEVTEYY